MAADQNVQCSGVPVDATHLQSCLSGNGVVLRLGRWKLNKTLHQNILSEKIPQKPPWLIFPHSHITPSHLWILQRSHPEKQATFTTTNSISHRLQKFFDCAGCPKLQGHLTKGPAHSESLMSNCLANSCILMSPQVHGIRIGHWHVTRVTREQHLTTWKSEIDNMQSMPAIQYQLGSRRC